jgi:hypothetical protein
MGRVVGRWFGGGGVAVGDMVVVMLKRRGLGRRREAMRRPGGGFAGFGGPAGRRRMSAGFGALWRTLSMV